MKYNYIDIEAFVRRAQQQRSDAMGEILSHSWKNFREMLSRLVHHHAHSDGHLSHS